MARKFRSDAQRKAVMGKMSKVNVGDKIIVMGSDPEEAKALAEAVRKKVSTLDNVAMPRRLPVVKISGKDYFRDDRLGEYRNVKDPFDRILMD